MMKHPYNINIAVLVIFFNRSEPLAKVFKEIKKARPSRLYLHQDGPRKNRNDENGINACREIFNDQNIDWECDVHRLYRDENLGCDPAEYMSQKWFFDQEEMGIVLEDDDVPSQSFFLFAKELLEKYKDDKTISIICGTNPLEISEKCKYSYFFTKAGSIWGWASWRRFFELEDPLYQWLDDKKKIEHIQKQLSRSHFKRFYQAAIEHRKTGKAYYETLYQAALCLSDGFAVVPKYNLVKNIGVTEDSVHNVSDFRLLPKDTQKIFTRNKYEINFPLIHPDKIERDLGYEKKRIKSPIRIFFNNIEYGLRIIRYKGLHFFVRKFVMRMKNNL